MTLICGGALAVGLLMAFVLPFLPFAASLTAAVLLGTAVSLVRGQPFGDTILSALSILVACQAGYGLGLIGAALAEGLVRTQRRWWRSEDGTPGKRLRSERK